MFYSTKINMQICLLTKTTNKQYFTGVLFFLILFKNHKFCIAKWFNRFNLYIPELKLVCKASCICIHRTSLICLILFCREYEFLHSALKIKSAVSEQYNVYI